MKSVDSQYLRQLMADPHLNILDYIRYQNVIFLLKNADKLAEIKHSGPVSASSSTEITTGVSQYPKCVKKH